LWMAAQVLYGSGTKSAQTGVLRHILRSSVIDRALRRSLIPIHDFK